MQIKLLTLALAALAVAAPRAELDKRASLCPSSKTPLCCQLDVDGVLDATCASPTGSPKNKKQFAAACASTGLTAECCILPVLGDALLCNAP